MSGFEKECLGREMRDSLCRESKAMKACLQCPCDPEKKILVEQKADRLHDSSTEWIVASGSMS